MAKKKTQKKENKELKKKEDESFDYKKYIEENITNPKAFLYYVIVNDLIFKNKEEVEDFYRKFKILGGN